MALLERDRHAAALEGWLRETAAGQGRLAFVGGEAGVGKTALIDQFRQVASGRARVLRGACDALSTPHPLGPLLDIAAEVGGELDRALRQGASRHEVFHAALTELSAGLTPTLVVIEDAHWADEATFDLLRFLGRRLSPLRALVLVTYRADEVGPNHPLRLAMGDLATTGVVRRLDLTPLSLEGIRTLAAGSGLDPAALHRLTGGNPFFAHEVLANPPGEGGIPPTVRDVVVARASRLSPAGRAALDAAAVIGSPIDAHLLIEAGETTTAAIDACLASGMLVPADHGYAFRHELARTAIHDAIAPARRRDLHAAVLAALRATSAGEHDVTRLAHHAEAAGDRQAVLTYAPAAACHAAVLGAKREASAQYARALRFAAGLPADARLALFEAYAEVSDLAGLGAAGIPMREEMIALARQGSDRIKEAEHLGWLADTLSEEGRYAKAEQAADAAVACLAGLPEGAMHAWAYCHRAQVQSTGGDLRAAIAWGERGVALATRLGDVRARIFGLMAIGEARLTGGDEAQGRADLEQCVALAREAGLDGLVAASLVNLGAAHAKIYQFAHADRRLREAIAFATDREEDNWRPSSLVWLAQTRLAQGDWTNAADLAAAALRLPAVPIPDNAPPDPRSGALPVGVAASVRMRALVTLGRIRARRGDPDADTLLAEALALVGSEAPFRYVAPIRAARAEAAWLAGDPARTIVEAQAALAQTTGHQQAWLAGELAIWRWRAGEAIAPPPGLPPPFALEMAGAWAAAADAWDALGCPYEAALALLDGDEPALRRALAIFDRLGAAPASAIASRRLRELGVRGIPRGPRPATRTNPAGLTDRELQIVPLLAAGQSTAAIAARLFLSPKTVEHHIGRIFAKLDVHARHEVAAAAERLGVSPAPGQDREPAPPK
jgi:DNA-binding CsgD family transcriptional regulator/tetratricopeptide (TPR) repeat protein